MLIGGMEYLLVSVEDAKVSMRSQLCSASLLADLPRRLSAVRNIAFKGEMVPSSWRFGLQICTILQHQASLSPCQISREDRMSDI